MAILFTGLTGNLGSSLGILLNEREKIFCLVRNGKKRIKGGELCGIDAAQIINGDITQEMCGINKKKFIFLQEQNIRKIVHCAASIKFDKNLAEQTWTINHKGTINILHLAKLLRINEIHYISTAYASGRRNPYEDSKAAAESAIINSGLNYSIYAPSIIVGDSVTGYTKSFDGFYGFFTEIYRIAEAEKRKQRAKKVHLPIYIRCSDNSTANLIPIDWVIKTLLGLIFKSACNEIYYLAQFNPPLSSWVMKVAFQYLGIEGVQIIGFYDAQPEHKNRKLQILQRAINRGLERYRPYVFEERNFSLDSTKQALKKKFVNPPPITTELLEKYLQFAIDKKFGNYKGVRNEKNN